MFWYDVNAFYLYIALLLCDAGSAPSGSFLTIESHEVHYVFVFALIVGRRSSLRLSARRMTSSTTKSGKRKRPVSRINSEQLSTAEFEAYVQIVWKKIPITLRYRCLCIDSLYFKAYMERNKRENVISWMVRDGSFAQRYVFVPICQANHWSLLILCNFGKDFNNTARPCILLLDSLETREENIEPDVRKFVFAMYKKWKPESSSQHIHNIPFRKPKVPQQKDGNRCGYYVIFFIYRFLLDCMDEFNIDNDYPSFMTQDWFTQSEFDSFSENLSYIWQDVAYEDIQTAVDTEENAMKEDIAEKKGDDINKQTALVLYTPESSQEKDNIAQCDNINEETAIVLYTPESSQEKINIAHDEVKVQKKILKIKVKSVDVRRSPRLATPDAKRRAIEIEPVQLHGSRRSVTEAVKRRRIKTTPPMDARGTRSVARKGKKVEQRSTSKKGKKVEHVEYVTSSDAETESEHEVKVIEKIKRTAKRKRSERDDKRKKVEHLECIISTDAETESEQEVEEIKKARKRSATRKTNRRDVHNESSKRKTSKKKNDKTGKKKRNEGKQHIEMPKKLKLRAHPSKFSKAMENLSTDQKQWIKDAGFEDLLSFSFRHIPNEMARNVVWFYDPYHNWLNLADKKVIRITEDEVHRVLGLPKGSRKVIIGPANTKTLEEWRDQYPERKAGHKITELSVMKAITRTGELNLKFKQNFMVLMYNLFIRCTTGSYVSQDVLKLVGSFDEVSEMNWCKLVVDGLKDASLAWLEDPTTQYYTGSLMFLIFFYLDRVQNEVIKVERKDTAFTGWSNFHVLQRNQVEIVNDSYGKGVIEGYEVPEDSEVEGEDYTTEDAGAINIQEIKDTHEEIHVDDDLKQNEPEVLNDMIEEPNEETIVNGDCNNEFAEEAFKDISVANEIIEKAYQEPIVTADNDNESVQRNFPDSQQFHTPRETIKGVQSIEMDAISAGIMSIAKDINYAHSDDEELINEGALMLQIRSEIDEIKKMKKIVYENLRTARALFSTNPDLEGLEKDFRQVINDNNGVESVERIPVKLKVEERPRREVKVSELHKSPFRERTIDIEKPNLTKAEEDVWKWLNAFNDYPLQQVFTWDNKAAWTKHEIQTLQVDRQLVCGVLDTYACILNEEEKFRSVDSPHRFFCTTYNTIGTFSRRSEENRLTDVALLKENQYRRFKENLDHVLQKHFVDIKNIDLIFFPIHDINHYYVICFNLKIPTIEILDNNKIGGDLTSIYDGIPESLQQNFVKYMMDISERKATEFGNVPIIRLEMKWRTEKNKTDCGVFAIRHMETYKGNGLRNWDSKFVPENEKQTQKRQLKKARQLYAFKIISSHLNCLRGTMQQEIDETISRI
ncbi:hypothetical protein POM88_022889 [Heracleum sosnowskyi]|uniref:Ubiquitin-like protease family profile domain-containing protein n=1 Tax=Heracleum sosnowskyi TaxID=360622 RepID=A0AAD8IHL6_9APIA|nr:hypothetical protein POM88_022889 [Heracleum sosnowskyi]